MCVGVSESLGREESAIILLLHRQATGTFPCEESWSTVADAIQGDGQADRVGQRRQLQHGLSDADAQQLENGRWNSGRNEPRTHANGD